MNDEIIMNYQKIGNEVKNLYNHLKAKKYRESDKKESEDHKHRCNILLKISLSFGHKISILDLGCGTGRYFHCLKNTERLVGIDISSHMLEEAHNPVRKEEIKIDHIDLMCANIFGVVLPLQSFDFIYSIGVLGEHSPFNLHICNKLFDLLKPNGVLFFTIVDISSASFKRRISDAIYPLLPSVLKKYFEKKISKRLKSFYMTYKKLKEIMESSQFIHYKITKYVPISGWKGAHYEVYCQKR